MSGHRPVTTRHRPPPGGSSVALDRGECSCGWTAQDKHRNENTAVEEAVDHAFPGWRDLPLMPGNPGRGASAAQLRRWEAQVRDAYPADWLARGGPIRTRRIYGGGRHVPGRAPGGGYDMGGSVDPPPAPPVQLTPDPAREREWVQPTLFP